MSVSGKTILVGVSAGIAAYKAADLVSKLRQQGAQVIVVMTPAAAKFVTPLTFETLSGRAVVTSLFDDRPAPTPDHIAVADEADAAVVAPATADVLAKMAVGIADDALTTTLVAFDGPVIVCPAMNAKMWAHPTVGQNIQTLKERGVQIVGPASGWLACGYEGTGRLASVDDILAAASELFA